LGAVSQVSQVSRGSESELDEEIDLAAAGNTVVGKCRVDECQRVGTYMAGGIEVWIVRVGVPTVATLWPLLRLGLGAIGVLEVVLGTADTTATCTTLVCPVTI
jgi:hypothetical protein